MKYINDMTYDFMIYNHLDVLIVHILLIELQK